MNRTDQQQPVYVRRSTDAWIKIGIAAVLLDLFRRPLKALAMVLLIPLVVGMLVWPGWTVLGVASMVMALMVHHRPHNGRGRPRVTS